MIYLYGYFPFLNNKINLMVCLKNSNVFFNFFFNSSSSLIENLYWQLYSIKLLLTFLYSRKQLQFLHLRLWIPPFKLSTRFDSDVAINPILFMNFILYDINSVVLLLFLPIFTTSFFIGMGKVLYFSLFSAIQSN